MLQNRMNCAVLEMWEIGLAEILFRRCSNIAPLSAREHSNKYFNNQAHIRDNGRQKKILVLGTTQIVTTPLLLFAFY